MLSIALKIISKEKYKEDFGYQWYIGIQEHFKGNKFHVWKCSWYAHSKQLILVKVFKESISM